MLYNARNLALKIDGVNMDCAVFGKGNKPLVMIPGLSTRGVKGSALPLAHMYRIFARDYRVYVFDRKAVIPDEYTVEDIAEDVAKGMSALGISSADVFGVSQGGMIAQYLAINHPELVRKLVLGLTLSRENETVRSVVENWIRMAEAGDYRAFVLDMFEKMYSESYVRRYRWLFPILSRLGKPRDGARFVRLAKACLTCDTYDELYRIQCPTLVLGARRDQVVTGEASEEIAKRLGCAIYMYDDLGHAAYEEAKDFNKRVLDYLMDGPHPKERTEKRRDLK